jgi:regulator of sigma E protease
MILISILVLGFLIFIHELGHFLLAKWNNVGVVEFAIGFGRPLLQRKYGETMYSLRLIPLGGYVRMVGDDPRALVAADQAPAGGEGARAESELTGSDVVVDPALLADKSRWFLSKSYWPKFSIVLAGPAFNLIFAVLAAIGSYALFGRDVPLDTPVIGAVIPAYPAEKGGMKAGDTVKSIDGKAIASWVELADTVGASGGKEMSIVVERPVAEGAEERSTVSLTISGTSDAAELAMLDSGAQPATPRFKIGIVPASKREAVPFGTAIKAGFLHVAYLSELTIKGLVGMVQGAISPRHIGGPIFIFKEAAQSARRGAADLVAFMVFLSVSLAILNLLPIPILDGGHLVFFTIEALKGSPVSLRFQERANQVGMALLLLLMVFAMGNDILKLL